MKTKKCSKCGGPRLMLRTDQGGMRCEPCTRASHAAYRLTHKEERSAKQRIWYAANTEYVEAYRAATIQRSSRGVGNKMHLGAAGEHFVIYWLLARGLDVGGPYNQQGPHDLFVKIKSWYTVQVRVGSVNRNTGYICVNKSGITSDLTAAVDLVGRRIRWVSNTKKRVPAELTE